MTTYTSQPDETSGVDTFIESGSPTTNNATSALLQTGESSTATSTFRFLVKFDISSIPSDATINSATLSLYMAADGTLRASNNRTMRAYRLKRAWVENQATWNIYATSNNWSTAGGFHADDCEQTDIGTVAMATTDANGTEKQISLTAAQVQEWVSSAFANNGLLLKMDTELNDAYRFHSASGATGGLRPKLVIDYTEAGGGGGQPTMRRWGGSIWPTGARRIGRGW